MSDQMVCINAEFVGEMDKVAAGIKLILQAAADQIVHIVSMATWLLRKTLIAGKASASVDSAKRFFNLIINVSHNLEREGYCIA